MPGDLSSLSIPLWIMAVLSVLQALLLIGVGVAGYLVYSRVMTLINELEARQIAPLREKVDAILADVKGITARVSQQTERVDHAITGTIDRVDNTAERVRAGVHDKVSQAAGVMRGVRAVIMSLLHKESHA
jgi:hypothetical protein